MTRLTHAEATELLETAFNVTGEDAGYLVEATIADMDESRAWRDVESYLAMLPREIDPETIQIKADVIEGSDLDAVMIAIQTGAP